MKIIKNVQELIMYRQTLDDSVGFVPTMGALHAGHASLIKQAKMQNSHVIVSVFVNPTQFLPGEDLSTYPKKESEDIRLCEDLGVDAIFMPHANEIYKSDEAFLHAPKLKGFILEGARRPGHFDGVLSVLCKLFNLTRPTRAYFGKKDAQQLYLVKQFVRDFFLPTKIIACEIMRDEEGLALSSRNAYLDEAQKKQALKLSRALNYAKEQFSQNIDDFSLIKKGMEEILAPLKIDYIQAVNYDFEASNKLQKGDSIVLLAVFVGKTRLIDNLWI